MKEAIKIVEQEIDWHQRNTTDVCTKGSLSELHQDGFVKGLEHIRDLLIQAGQIGEEDEDNDKNSNSIRD